MAGSDGQRRADYRDGRGAAVSSAATRLADFAPSGNSEASEKRSSVADIKGDALGRRTRRGYLGQMSDRQRKIKARIEAVLAARNRGDWDALFAEIDPDAEWEPIAETVIYRGREAITEYFARWDEAWAEFRIDADRIDVSRDEDLALLAARYRGRGKGSAVDVDGNFYTVWELRQGRVLRCREYAHESEAQAEFERRR
jgi:ketosteroid isomerase-like protein